MILYLCKYVIELKLITNSRHLITFYTEQPEKLLEDIHSNFCIPKFLKLFKKYYGNIRFYLF